MSDEETIGNSPIGIEFIRISLKHRLVIAIVIVISILASVVFSSPFFIKPLFKAEAIIYPASSNTTNALITSDMHFASEMDIDNQIQLLQSTILRDSIIQKYNLMRHYDIDTLSSKRFYNLYKEFAENIIIERTRYNSISISVYDIDPRTAASIANDIVRIGDEVKASILKKNLAIAFNSVAQDLQEKVGDITNISNLISQNSRKGVDSFAPISSLAGLSLQSLKSRYRSETQIYNDLKWKYEVARNNLSAAVPGSYVISPAESSLVKSYPQRTVIVSISAVCAYILTVVFFILQGSRPALLKTFNW
jgi:uncharacterized protein involved in exopolysaccharide biosynthesis